MKANKICLVAALAMSLVFSDAGQALAQALPNINSARVAYNTRKTTVKPEGELKAQIDQIDAAMATASRLGRAGDVRRLLAKGMALLAGRPWTDADEFQASLVIRTDRVIVDSSSPYSARLEQIFAPAIELTRSLTASASLRPRVPPAGGATGGGAAPQATPPIALGTFEGVGRDLREGPFPMTLHVASVPDGTYALRVEVFDQDRPLGYATLNVALHKGLDARLRALESAAVKAPADMRADLRYPADYVRKINEGLVELGQFNVAAELAAAEGMASAAKSGKNPFAGRTGDFERHYTLEAAAEIMPYRLYVPKAYNGSKAYPLIVALHGLGGTEDSFFDGYSRRVPALAEERGYIVVAPLGFRVDGFYGSGISPSADPAARKRSELSEQDVMEAVRRTREQYKIDGSRIYLMGHSMGGIGTWALGAKYPDIWAALAPIAGTGSPAAVERMRHIAQIVVHGDADATVSVNGSRNMVAAMKTHGAEVTYIEVPGGSHGGVVVPNLAAIFDFFDTHRKPTVSTQQ